MSYLSKTDAFINGLGLESYRVGGSVRDEILGRYIKDADYMIRADLDTIHKRLRKAAPTGDITKLKLRNGTHVGWRVAIKGLGLIEICLPRTEISTGPGHGDFDVIGDPNVTLEEDAKRRDITINALYKRVSDGELIDPLGCGVQHINDKLITVTYETSFRDDPLRILRVFRFYSILDGFDIEANTRRLIELDHYKVDGLTAKGVSGTALDELKKLLMGDNVADTLRIMRDYGVLGRLLPELVPMFGFEQESKWHDLTVDEHTFSAIDAAARLNFPLRVRLALLFHDSGKPAAAWKGDDGRLHYYEHKKFPDSANHEDVSARLARKALKRLNTGNGLRYDVERLIQNHMDKSMRPTKVRQMRCALGDDLLKDLFRHMLCDTMGKGEDISLETLIDIQKMEEIRAVAEKQNVPKSIKDLKDQGLINGQDAMDLGAKGKNVGILLTQILYEVVAQPKLATREWVIKRATKLTRKLK
jgi:tRNA nucleotidyltransferase (CCA-adding enzyme)